MIAVIGNPKTETWPLIRADQSDHDGANRILVGAFAKLHFMEIHHTPELENKLNQIASQSGRDAGQIVQELVET